MLRPLTVILLSVLILSMSASAQNGSITLDYIGGLIGPDSLCADRPIILGLRVTNTTGSTVSGYTNGFQVYSPTGAEWVGTTAEYVGSFASYFDNTFIEYFSADGIGADTVAFHGFAIAEPGLPAGFSEIAFEITIHEPANWDGHTICIDSAYFPPAGVWRWTSSTTTAEPDWAGPHCFTLHRLPCLDDDGDGVLCGCDNCEGVFNPNQEDSNFDYIGDACECCVLRGDITHSGAIDVSDLTYLINLLFIIDFPQVCWAEADFNGDGSVDISDLTGMTAYMFHGGDGPAPCP